MNKRGIIRGPSRTEKCDLARTQRASATEAERTLWEHLRAGRLAGSHWCRQQVTDGFIVDFYCHRAGLVVELDGAVHYSQTAYDAERDQILAQRELRILRIPNQRVAQDLPGVLARIPAMLETTTACPTEVPARGEQGPHRQAEPPPDTGTPYPELREGRGPGG
jgi:very-short-patch-repair endonuclease